MKKEEHGDFDKKMLADLLYQAKGTRTQTQFARDCDLSFCCLNGFLNQQRDTPPAPSTLLKIAKNSSVSYESLLAASGYDSERYVEQYTQECMSKNCIATIHITMNKADAVSIFLKVSEAIAEFCSLEGFSIALEECCSEKHIDEL